MTKSFVDKLVINKKASKGISSFLMLRKGKIKSMLNYSKRYWKTYNKIKKCSKELTVVSYKLELTPRERV